MRLIEQLTKTVWAGVQVAIYFLVFCLPVQAADEIGRGYIAVDDTVRVGMAVSRVKDDAAKVEPLTTNNLENFVGVITTINDNVLSVTTNDTNVLVTGAGNVQIFVSDVTGRVNKNDYLSASPIKGVLQKAKDDATTNEIVATALQDFDAIDTTENTVGDNNGQQKSIQIGKLEAQISEGAIINNSTKKSEPFLVYVGQSITGRPVSTTQAVIAMIILLVLLIVEGAIIYGAIHSTINAVGRNPLAKKAVFQQLLQVSWLSLTVLAFGLGAIYLVLWI